MSVKKLAQGAFILTCANVITRFMGFFYRIFMSNTIGAEGMGLYQLIMPLYMLVWSISSSGVTIAVAKLAAEESAKGNYKNTKKILFSALSVSLAVSLFLSIIVFTESQAISVYFLRDKRTGALIKILSLCFPFMALSSCVRGYFLGVQKHTYPAVSQVAEQLVRIGVTIILCPVFLSGGMEKACAAAVTGVVFGEILSFLIMAFSAYGDMDGKKTNRGQNMPLSKCLTTIIVVSFPLMLSKVSVSFLGTVESILIPQRLQLYSSEINSMAAFGSLTGMAMPLLQFPSSVLIAFSSSLMPAISAAAVTGNKRGIEKAVEKSLSLTSLMAFFVFSFFFIFGEEICSVIYGAKETGVLLKKLSVLCPFMYTGITINGILNGLGEHKFIFKSGVISSFINIGIIYFLMPVMGVEAFIVSSLVSMIFSSVTGVLKCCQKTKNGIDVMSVYIMPFVCGICAVNTYKILNMFFAVPFLYGMVCFAVIYCVFIFISNSCSIRNDFAIMIKSLKH